MTKSDKIWKSINDFQQEITLMNFVDAWKEGKQIIVHPSTWVELLLRVLFDPDVPEISKNFIRCANKRLNPLVEKGKMYALNFDEEEALWPKMETVDIFPKGYTILDMIEDIPDIETKCKMYEKVLTRERWLDWFSLKNPPFINHTTA